MLLHTLSHSLLGSDKARTWYQVFLFKVYFSFCDTKLTWTVGRYLELQFVYEIVLPFLNPFLIFYMLCQNPPGQLQYHPDRLPCLQFFFLHPLTHPTQSDLSGVEIWSNQILDCLLCFPIVQVKTISLPWILKLPSTYSSLKSLIPTPWPLCPKLVFYSWYVLFPPFLTRAIILIFPGLC